MFLWDLGSRRGSRGGLKETLCLDFGLHSAKKKVYLARYFWHFTLELRILLFLESFIHLSIPLIACARGSDGNLLSFKFQRDRFLKPRIVLYFILLSLVSVFCFFSPKSFWEERGSMLYWKDFGA